MRDDDLDDVAENIRVLVRAELEAQHQLDGHPTPLGECPVCRAHDHSAALPRATRREPA